MADEQQPMERRQSRANTFQISGKAFGLLASLLVLAIGGLVRVLWDQHSNLTALKSQVEYLVSGNEQEDWYARADGARLERRIQKLELDARSHEGQAQRIIGEWSYQLRDHERRIENCEKQLNANGPYRDRLK